MVDLRRTHTFRIVGNVGKMKMLHNALTQHQVAAQDALRCLKTHTGMLSNAAASQSVYEFLRYAHANIPSTVSQELCRNLKSSTLSESRKKLNATTRAYVPMSLNNQAINIKYVNNKWRYWMRIPIGMDGTRIVFKNFALEGEHPSFMLMLAKQFCTVRVLRRKRGRLYAQVVCKFDAPDLMPAPSYVVGQDQNFGNTHASDGTRTSLAEYQHKKHEFHERRKTDDKLVRDHRWSDDFMHKMTTRDADRILAKYGRDIIVALEELKNIRKSSPTKTGKGKLFNQKLHNRFPYAQYQSLLRYKLAARGIDLVLVPPAYTSQQCSCCSRIDSRNRRSQSRFVCSFNDCGYRINADLNASINVGLRYAKKTNVDLVPYSRRDDQSVAVGRCCS